MTPGRQVERHTHAGDAGQGVASGGGRPGGTGRVRPGGNGRGRHVVAAIGAEGQLAPLMTLSCALANGPGGGHEGRVTVLHVLGSGSGAASGQRPAWLVVPEKCGGVPVSVEVRAGRDPSAEILAAVRKDTPDLLVLGWRGKPSSGRYLVGRNLDALVQYAPCDTAIVRISPGQPLPSGGVGAIERVLVAIPSSPDP